MDKKIKSAIIGTGAVAHVHAEAVNRLGNAVLLSCCDADRNAAEAFAAKYGGAAFSSLRDLYENGKPDVVHITSPHYAHVPQALYALERGSHVILEKPAATTLSELKTLERYMRPLPGVHSGAQVAGAPMLGICFQNRYNFSVKHVKQQIENGVAGAILGGRAFMTWKRAGGYYTENPWRGAKNTEGSSVLLNQSIHTLDILCYLMGVPTDVQGSVANRSLYGVINTEDTAEMTLFYEGGVRGLFYATVSYVKDETVFIEIVCENATYRIEGNRLTVVTPYGEEVMEPPAETTPGKAVWGYGHMPLIADFYDCVMNDKRFPIDIISGGIALKAALEVLK
ncbi:MAG: Gfo/Idh/MocA family oxidoreductase [Defluviitaleaceae bacterium]|nr:Gfo/Idh/MocA family oxidoreductase [Defluviitaleaceae bacterium]